MKKVLLIICFLPIFSVWGNNDFPFSLDLRKDCMLGGTAVAILGGQCLATLFSDEEDVLSYGLENLNKDDLMKIDRGLIREYSEGMDITSSVISYTLIASTALLAIKQEWKDILTGLVMYGETMLTVNGITEISKHLIDRYRPYCYKEDTKESLLESDNSSRSFMSGHTSRSFATAAFITTVYSHMYPEGDGKWWVGLGTFGAAAAVGALRVASGCHFVSDVVAGAALGTVIGWLIPTLHLNSDSDSGLEVSMISESGKPGLVFNYSR